MLAFKCAALLVLALSCPEWACDDLVHVDVDLVESVISLGLPVMPFVPGLSVVWVRSISMLLED
jgi:hypothetical protein